MTSMNGVTLISCGSEQDRHRRRCRAAPPLLTPPPSPAGGACCPIEVARDEAQHLRRGIADQRPVAGRRARELIVDDDRRDGGNKADGGGEQRLGDAGRDHGEVGGLRLGDADEAVHDAPDRAEQADERRRGADGGEHAGALVHVAAGRRPRAGQARGDALLDRRSCRCRSADRRSSSRPHRSGSAGCRAADSRRARASMRERSSPIAAEALRSRRAGRPSARVILASHTVHVTTRGERTGRSSSPCTRTSADRNIDQGDRSCGRCAGLCCARACELEMDTAKGATNFRFCIVLLTPFNPCRSATNSFRTCPSLVSQQCTLGSLITALPRLRARPIIPNCRSSYSSVVSDEAYRRA